MTNKAYRGGFRSGYNGRKKSTQPYPRGTQEWANWSKGFVAGVRKRNSVRRNR